MMIQGTNSNYLLNDSGAEQYLRHMGYSEQTSKTAREGAAFCTAHCNLPVNLYNFHGCFTCKKFNFKLKC